MQYGQIEDLTGFVHIGKGQFPVARLALVWYVVDNYFAGWAAWLKVRPG